MFLSEQPFAACADLLHPSKIGSGFISSSLDANINTRRTSASLLLDGMVAASNPGFTPPMKAVQAAAWQLTGDQIQPFLAPVLCIIGMMVWGPCTCIHDWWNMCLSLHFDAWLG